MSLSLPFLVESPVAKRARIDPPASSLTSPPNARVPAAAVPASAPPRPFFFPASVSDVAKRLREAREAREALAAAQAATQPPPTATSSIAQHAAPASAGGSAAAASAPGLSTASLMSLRLEREAALAAKRSLARELNNSLWVEFARQADAMRFVTEQQQRHSDTGAEDGALGATAAVPGDLRLFACELAARERPDGGKPHSGARRFIVSTYQDFWPRYFSLPPSQRHHYELIAEGAPCHLYFDIECQWQLNPQLRPRVAPGAAVSDHTADEYELMARAADDSAAGRPVDVECVMRALCDELATHLGSTFGSALSGTRVENMLQLDSSSSVKFSRHLIVRLAMDLVQFVGGGAAGKTNSAAPPPPPPTYMFRNNAHAGRYVRSFLKHVRMRAMAAVARQTEGNPAPTEPEELRQWHRDTMLRYVMVHEEAQVNAASISADSSPTSSSSPIAPLMLLPPPPLAHCASLVDSSVYTRNRSFRMFLSSKNARVSVAPEVVRAMEAELLQQHQQQQDQVELPVLPVPRKEAAPTLLVSEFNAYPLTGKSLQETWLDSLVCNVQCGWDELNLLTFSEKDEAAILKASECAPETMGGAGGDDAAESASHVLGKRARAAASSTAAAGSSSSSSSSSSGRRFLPCPSPFPRLERFLLSFLRSRSRGTGPDVRLRGWNCAQSVVSFTVDGDRFCGNIGRAHRSNGIYFVLDLAGRCCVQKCWDPQCKYFSSEPAPIPTWICELEMEELEGEDEEQHEGGEEQKDAPAADTGVRRSLLDDDDDDGWDLDALSALEASILAPKS